MPTEEPIDVVYTWVDGGRPDYQQLLGRHSKDPRQLNPERYRDLGILRYGLRSIETNAPWIRNIILFTARPHVPAWLRVDHPKVRIVHHDEVMPDDGTLPTFNSNVIDSFLHLIPGVSRQFIYMSDDYVLGSPVSRSDFVSDDGRLKVFGTLAGEAIRGRVYDYQFFSFGLLEHGPVWIDAEAWGSALETGGPELAALRKSRFRAPNNLRPERIYRWYLLTHRKDRSVAEPFWKYLRYSVFHKLKPGGARQRRTLEKIGRERPKFICLNDDLGDRSDPEVVAALHSLLNGMFPRPSSFELS